MKAKKKIFEVKETEIFMKGLLKFTDMVKKGVKASCV